MLHIRVVEQIILWESAHCHKI